MSRDVSAGLEKPSPTLRSTFRFTIAYHRRWLRARGLLDRPWLVFGAAPGPSLLRDPPSDLVYAYVKLSGRSAAKLGLPNAELTFLPEKIPVSTLGGLAPGNVLRMSRKLPLQRKLQRLVGSTAAPECDLTHRERDLYITHTLGSLFSGEGNDDRPSNGVALICFALAMGVPQVVVSGISLDSDGYEYDREARTRRHVPQDLAALRKAASVFPQLVTTEPGLHRLAAIPLIPGSVTAP